MGAEGARRIVFSESLRQKDRDRLILYLSAISFFSEPPIDVGDFFVLF